jgi:hypothetical protein
MAFEPVQVSLPINHLVNTRLQEQHSKERHAQGVDNWHSDVQLNKVHVII